MLSNERGKFEWLSSSCTGCGNCAGMCPTNAIEMRRNRVGYIPFIANSKCEKCGLCLDVCPGYFTDLTQLNKFVFRRIPTDVLLGNYIDCYIGHSTDEKIRYDAASGGIATALLIFALNQGMIEGAVVTKMREDNALEPRVFVAQTEKEIIAASKSKYCPVPVNIAIKELLSKNGKFAVVGLPCHIQGFRKAEMLSKKLKEKVILHLGLFCSHNVNFLGTRFLLNKINVRVEDVVRIDYRGKGWPGGMTVELRDHTKRFLPQRFYWGHFFSNFFFTPIRCTLCSDALNELADISLGDAWLHELIGRSIGESIIIPRTKIGHKLLREAILKGKVKAKIVSRDNVVRSQRGILSFKKKNLGARTTVLGLLGKQVPRIDSLASEYQQYNLGTFVGAILTYLNIYVSLRKTFQWFLKHVPLRLIRMYSRLIRALTDQF